MMNEEQKTKLFNINFDEQKLLEMSTAHGEHQYAADFRIGFRKGFNRGKDAGFQAGLESNSELLSECENVLLNAWGQLEAGSKVSEQVDEMIEKLRSRNGGMK